MNTLRTGYTTGTCAAAAAKAAAIVLSGRGAPRTVETPLPFGGAIETPVLYARLARGGRAAVAAVRKDSGDDKDDVTHGMKIVVTLRWKRGRGVAYVAGEGVGTVTKPGLQIPPGEPAINPGPREMIRSALASVTKRGAIVEVAAPGGRKLAASTFNPRLGVRGGLSILGTTGIVRPRCRKALLDSLKCALNVAAACGAAAPALVPGNIGLDAVGRHFALGEQEVVEAGNEWGFALDALAKYRFQAVMIAGHPGKLAKLAMGQWDTHSSRSESAAEFVAELRSKLSGDARSRLARKGAKAPRKIKDRTVEGIFAGMRKAERTALADELARRIQAATSGRLNGRVSVAVFLVNMAGEKLGSAGDFSIWREKPTKS